MTLHPETLGRTQATVLRQLGPVASERGFYLAGGTALALQLGHRKSVDLDWFTPEPMGDPLLLAHAIRGAGIEVNVVRAEAGTLHTEVQGVRVSWLEYPYPLLLPTHAAPEYACSLAGPDDIAAMKMSAVAQRGARKDFIDVYALCLRHKPLAHLLDTYRQRFGVRDVSPVLVGLSYFDDADRERTPTMLWRANWRTVKADLTKRVRGLSDRH